mgnify:CR=1 FL=1
MGNGNRVEFLVAVCALLTSVVAIWVAWDQSRVMRAQQHGMVYPVLQVEGFVSTTSESVSMGLRLSNTGVGPALVESVVARTGGERLETLEPYRAYLASDFDISWTGMAGRSLAPGAEVDAIAFEWETNEITTEQLNTAVAKWGEIDFDFCYCSVFNRCWRVEVGTSRARSTKSCPSNDRDLFEEFGMNRVMPSTSIQDEASQ